MARLARRKGEAGLGSLFIPICYIRLGCCWYTDCVARPQTLQRVKTLCRCFQGLFVHPRPFPRSVPRTFKTFLLYRKERQIMPCSERLLPVHDTSFIKTQSPPSILRHSPTPGMPLGRCSLCHRHIGLSSVVAPRLALVAFVSWRTILGAPCSGHWHSLPSLLVFVPSFVALPMPPFACFVVWPRTHALSIQTL